VRPLFTPNVRPAGGSCPFLRAAGVKSHLRPHSGATH
jgi:hypothetical protein